jgi:glutamate N-acetyltransferase/amino-acid N-acetyltransferase
VEIRTKKRDPENDRSSKKGRYSDVLPRGFRAAGVACGLKASKKEDLGILFSESACAGAAVFTRNQFAAAPIEVTRAHVRKALPRAIVVNSGNANACTGDGGVRDARDMAAMTARALRVRTEEVLVCSTGVIGKRLDMAKIERGIKSAARGASAEGWLNFTNAICTTDTFQKVAAGELIVGGKAVRMLGVAKGAGMIHPNMATMLCFIATDAAITPGALRAALGEATDASFNCVTVDGDTSTNDSVIVMANGAAGNARITLHSRALKQFTCMLTILCQELAKMIARDGEGATKFVTITVKGAANGEAAKRVAMSVARSNLVKATFYGEDPNWGRVVAAIGYSGVRVVPERVIVRFGDTVVFRKNRGVAYDVRRVRKYLSCDEVELQIELGMGQHSATVWTCDLTCEYVRFNAAYQT